MPRFAHRFLAAPVLLAVACPEPDDTTATPGPAPTSTPAPTATGPTADTFDTSLPEPALLDDVLMTVTLDGDPIADAWVGVGGGMHTRTDAQGQATLSLDGGWAIIASHPEARTQFSEAEGGVVTVALERFSLVDNPEYVFQDPGIAGDPGTTSQCGHCHGSMVIDWTASPHRSSASNPTVHDVYAGTARLLSASDCTAAGGTWRQLGAEENVVLFSHHPMVQQPGGFFVDDWDAIVRLVSPEAHRVAAAFAGHLHIDQEVRGTDAGYDVFVTDATWDDENTVRVV